MKVAVIGAGIVGITTAYELACDGHEVTVFERRSAAAEECSFANAGVVAPGYVTPWAAPGMPGKVLSHLLSRHSPVALSLPLSIRELRWMRQWLAACNLPGYLAMRAHMQRLAFYARQRLDHLTASLDLSFDASAGYMVLLRGEKDAASVAPGLQVLTDAGVKFAQIDAAAARAIEPGLNPDTPFAGAIHLPEDGVANCRQFALLLKQQAQSLGVKFEFNTAVAQLNPAAPASVLIANETQARSFDQVVVCAGLDSRALLTPLGLHLPLVAVYGYSITAPIRAPYAPDPAASAATAPAAKVEQAAERLQASAQYAPLSALMDERYKVAISRLGNRIRVAGSAQIGGHPEVKRAASLQTLYKVLNDWFPAAMTQQRSQGAHVQEWKGARPMLPDGPPVIGPSGVPGVWLNLGHGSSGWALSCGSARVLADQLANKAPDISVDGLGVERLKRL